MVMLLDIKLEIISGIVKYVYLSRELLNIQTSKYSAFLNYDYTNLML